MISEQIAEKIVEHALTDVAFLNTAKDLVSSGNALNRLQKRLNELRSNYSTVLSSKRINLVGPSFKNSWETEYSALNVDHSSDAFYLKILAKSINKEVIKLSSLYKKLKKEDFDRRTQVLVALYTLCREIMGKHPSRESKKILKRALTQHVRKLT